MATPQPRPTPMMLTKAKEVKMPSQVARKVSGLDVWVG